MNGILYKPASVVISGIQDEYPLFGKIESIYIVNTNDIFFKQMTLSTREFDHHRHVYVVETIAEIKTISLTSLYSVFPLHLRRTAVNGIPTLCLVLKHHIFGCLQC